MNAIIRFAFSHARTMLLVLILVIISGISSYIYIPKESTPDIKIPIIYISITYEGISPQDAQRLLIKPIEQEIRSIEGIKEIKASAYEGSATIIIEFHAGYNIDKAHTDVRDKVDIAKVNLPHGTKEPIIKEINLSQFPILLVKLSGEVPLRMLFKIARDLSDQIQATVSAVLKAEVVGDKDDCVEIIIDPTRYEQYPIVFDQLYQQLSRNNQIIPAGVLEQQCGAFSVKVASLFETVDDIGNLPILVNEEAAVLLKDLADIRRTFKDPVSIAHDRTVFGKSTPTVVLEISKRTGENLIQTVDAVKKIVIKEQKNWPDHISVDYAQDESSLIHDMLSDLQNNIICAIFLVMAIIVFFLGWRSALLVGVAIPGAFLMGVLVIQYLGHTVNIVVLFSLIFSVGMLVDGAVIVVEYADRRIDEGLSTYDAYLEAALRMTWPVITSTLTILVVFLPLLFWPGVVGQFMKFMPITLIAVLCSSILMALIFIPVIASLTKIQSDHNIHMAFLSQKLDQFTEWYLRKLEIALNYPRKIIGLAIIILIVIKLIHSFFGKGIEFFPDIEPDSIAVHVHIRGNFSIYEKENLVTQVEKTLLDMDEFRSIYTRIGEQSQRLGEEYAEDVVGVITLEFTNWQRRRQVKEIIVDVQKKINSVAGVYSEIIQKKEGPSDGKPVNIEIGGTNHTKIEETLKKLREFVETQSGFTAIEDTRSIPGIEWQLQINRTQAAKFEVDITSIGNVIKFITNGAKIGSYRPDDIRDEVDIVLRYKPEFRHLSQLQQLRLQTKQGLIPLSLFMKQVAKQRVGKIERVNGYEVLYLKADLKPDVLLVDKIKDIQNWIKTSDISNDVHIRFKGQEEDRQESSAFLAKAFGVALFLVAIILITQFNSFFSMALVLSAVVMSTAGVFIGLLVHNLAFGVVMGGIGSIALAGIVVSNNIILIDTFDSLYSKLKENVKTPSLLEVREVIVATCRQRLRPIILTKMTTILSLLPIMFGVNINFIDFEITQGAPSTQWWILLSTCIVYGVLFASCLTLVVTPCALMWRAQKHYK